MAIIQGFSSVPSPDLTPLQNAIGQFATALADAKIALYTSRTSLTIASTGEHSGPARPNGFEAVRALLTTHPDCVPAEVRERLMIIAVESQAIVELSPPPPSRLVGHAAMSMLLASMDRMVKAL